MIERTQVHKLCSDWKVGGVLVILLLLILIVLIMMCYQDAEEAQGALTWLQPVFHDFTQLLSDKSLIPDS